MNSSILQSQDDGIIIRSRRHRRRIRMPEDVALRATPIEFVALLFMNDFDAARPCFSEQTCKRGRLFISPNPQFAHCKIFQHATQSIQVIMVGMRQCNYVQPLQST